MGQDSDCATKCGQRGGVDIFQNKSVRRGESEEGSLRQADGDSMIHGHHYQTKRTISKRFGGKSV